jgi:hypothetical protein
MEKSGGKMGITILIFMMFSVVIVVAVVLISKSSAKPTSTTNNTTNLPQANEWSFLSSAVSSLDDILGVFNFGSSKKSSTAKKDYNTGFKYDENGNVIGGG